MNSNESNNYNREVTAVISHYIRPGRESGYEAWLEGISQVARQFEGHNGVTILRPQPGSRAEYVIILRFNEYRNLCQWMRSPQRQEWIDRAKPLTEKPENVQVLTGLEALVSLPNTNSPLPPKYKTAFVTWIGVFSVRIYFGLFFRSLFSKFALFATPSNYDRTSCYFISLCRHAQTNSFFS